MRTFTKLLLALFTALVASTAHADICADLRAIHQQSQSRFDGWKKDGPDSVMKDDKRGPIYLSNFMLDGAQSCAIADNSSVYTCIWRYPTPADMGRAYQRLVNDVKACAPLAKEPPGIIADEPQERRQGDLRQITEVTGLDYADAEVTILIGQMQLTGPQGLARNELKLSFSRQRPR
ncbi:vesicle formation protein [Herbaspirillum camelliae]|uniref:vesicle formation protein n=1 Tax=Herbaspirillum camelliae TaxID=1892903 RepID=UPI000949CDA5|nr:vesicle formation protein [Herbaspirillum camelliae]